MTTPLSPELEAILAMAERATPGPWSADDEYIVGAVVGGRPGGEVIGRMEESVRGLSRVHMVANAALIVALRNILPKLAAVLETHVLVPREPSEAMLRMMCVAIEIAPSDDTEPGHPTYFWARSWLPAARDAYRAMIAAASILEEQR